MRLDASEIRSHAFFAANSGICQPTEDSKDPKEMELVYDQPMRYRDKMIADDGPVSLCKWYSSTIGKEKDYNGYYNGYYFM
uniref:Uncharacterized protein n=1 Tax=Acrobeloides nanus TaxID=290746 RepID=A0A914DK77_9BILA